MNDSLFGMKVAKISAWVDNSEHNRERDREAALWGRVSKVSEEAGEAIGALIGYTAQNPRKGLTHTADDVRKELLDVALSALSAYEHMSQNNGSSIYALGQHINRTFNRAGLDNES